MPPCTCNILCYSSTYHSGVLSMHSKQYSEWFESHYPLDPSHYCDVGMQLSILGKGTAFACSLLPWVTHDAIIISMQQLHCV